MPPLDVPVLLAANQQSVYREQAVAIRRDFDADGPLSRRRRYEIAGYHHTPLPDWEPGSAIPLPRSSERERQCAPQYPSDAVRNPNLVGRPVMEAMFRNLSDWVERGIPAPHAALIESANGQARLDAHGNALGGVRLPEISVPIASYAIGSDKCSSTGWSIPFMQAKLRTLYGSRDAYLKRYGEAADTLAAQRLILPETAQRMKAEAAERAPAF